MGIKWTEHFINEVFSSLENQNVFLARMGIIRNTMFCEKCPGNILMSYVKKIAYIDGYFWICKKPCNFSKTVRAGTFFESRKLKMKTIFLIMYKYIKRSQYEDVSYELHISSKTVGLYVEMIRDAIVYHLEARSERIGGYDADGLPRMVEIDESYFFKSKYNRGRHVDGTWYIGGRERNSRRVFLVPVGNRNANTIVSVIIENVLPGTIIITDEWRAYSAALS